MQTPLSIFWFRRDLRLDDNVGLYNALKSGQNVLPIFIFDSEILKKLPKDDARVTFIHDTLQNLSDKLQKDVGSSIAIYHGRPIEIYNQLLETYNIMAVYTNHDYEPYATERDAELKTILESQNIAFHTFKDQVIFEKDEVVKKDGNPYVVYTPYMRTWKEKFKTIDFKFYPSEKELNNCVKNINLPNLSLEDIGFTRSNQPIKPYEVTPRIRGYTKLSG